VNAIFWMPMFLDAEFLDAEFLDATVRPAS
jgi:hypothetical protein